MRTIKDYDIRELRNLAANYERLGKTDAAEYQAALDELQSRDPLKLNIDRSISAIMAAAKDGRFISYGEVARANGLDWSYALNRQMPKHLDLILAKAYGSGLPLITSIVVNQKHIRSGQLEASSLKGFIAGAKRLGQKVEDEAAYLRDQQRRTFAFAGRTGRFAARASQ